MLTKALDARVSLLTASQRVRVGLPMAHDAISGEPVCWSYLTTKCNDSVAAEKLLAEHGRTAHRLHETWRVSSSSSSSTRRGG